MALIGLGIDLVDIERAEAMLAPRRRRVLDRLLTPEELAYVERMRHPARHLAVRLAAKEAVYKAFQAIDGCRAIGWREIEVVRGAFGRPSIRLHGLAARIHAEQGSPAIYLSLTHSDLTAGATAILER